MLQPRNSCGLDRETIAGKLGVLGGGAWPRSKASLTMALAARLPLRICWPGVASMLPVTCASLAALTNGAQPTSPPTPPTSVSFAELPVELATCASRNLVEGRVGLSTAPAQHPGGNPSCGKTVMWSHPAPQSRLLTFNGAERGSKVSPIIHLGVLLSPTKGQASQSKGATPRPEGGQGSQLVNPRCAVPSLGDCRDNQRGSVA